MGKFFDMQNLRPCWISGTHDCQFTGSASCWWSWARPRWRSNCKRLRRLMRESGIKAVAPKHRTSPSQASHAKYSYLLRDLNAARSCWVDTRYYNTRAASALSSITAGKFERSAKRESRSMRRNANKRHARCLHHIQGS